VWIEYMDVERHLEANPADQVYTVFSDRDGELHVKSEVTEYGAIIKYFGTIQGERANYNVPISSVTKEELREVASSMKLSIELYRLAPSWRRNLLRFSPAHT